MSIKITPQTVLLELKGLVSFLKTELKHVCLLLAFIGFLHGAFGQTQLKADSLITILEREDVSQKDQARLSSAIAYHHPIPSQSLHYAKQSLQIAQDLKDQELEAEAWEELSHVEFRLGNNTKSLEATYKALTIYEHLNLAERQAASYEQIASNYISNEDYSEAISNLIKAREIYKHKTNKTNYALALINLGEAYRLSNALDSASVQFKEVLNINSTLKNEMILAYASGNLGMVNSAYGNNFEAKQGLNTAIKILNATGDPYSSSIFLAELGNIHVKEGDFNSAETKYTEAFHLAKSNGLKEQIRDFSDVLAVFYEEQKAYDKALKFKKQFQIYQDSLINKANIQKIEQLKAGYEIGLREKEIKLLRELNENRKKLTMVLVIGSLLLGLVLYLLSKANKKLKRQKALIASIEKENS
jgi:tetratricopeptide (TPR) repeat protein